jgi:hypothetical protein
MKLTFMLLLVLLNSFAYGQTINQKVLSGKWNMTNPYENPDTSLFKEYWEFKGDSLNITREEKISSTKSVDNVDKSTYVVYLKKRIEKIPYSIVGQSIKFSSEGSNTIFDINELTEEKIIGKIIINNFTRPLTFMKIPSKIKS